ncbi:MAG: hypothetical protein PHI60_05910, partial [Candidatus Omnitrophica bacterium]|nr:hypothetical protein [Candidatus Omnitrophota bacterium]
WDYIDEAAVGSHDVNQTYNWTNLPDDIGTASSVRVSTLTGNSSIEVNDTSNATFNITGAISVTSPNGNELWYVGQDKTIQ